MRKYHLLGAVCAFVFGTNTSGFAAGISSFAIVCASGDWRSCENVRNTSATSSLDKTYTLDGGTAFLHSDGFSGFGIPASNASATITDYQPGSHQVDLSDQYGGLVANGAGSYRDQYTTSHTSNLWFTFDITGTINASTLPAPGSARTYAWMEVLIYENGSPVGVHPDVIWDKNGPHSLKWSVQAAKQQFAMHTFLPSIAVCG